MYAPPVDFSFKCLSTMADALSEEPSSGVRPVHQNPDGKFCSKALRLNNNILSELSGFTSTVTALMDDPAQLSWIDLSFNDLSVIDSALTEFKELKVLYLHGNSISKLSEMDKLGALPHLHSVTLHGNPLENEKGYRSYVISTLPHLKSLDFSSVTRQERDTAQIWRRGFNRQKHSKKISTSISSAAFS
ncbi:leucine-rich repeat-containing protein 51 [Amia ocellicauda]|uniref:leucine-rich repeat-containing protein 51 n=1 Tax=Amia ocellicauda TaxID=2972642 RepID=UPI003464C606